MRSKEHGEPLQPEDFTPELPVSYALLRYHKNVRKASQTREIVEELVEKLHQHEGDLEEKLQRPGTNITQFTPRRDPDPAA